MKVSYWDRCKDEDIVINKVSSIMHLINNQCVVSSEDGTTILNKEIHKDIRIILGDG